MTLEEHLAEFSYHVRIPVTDNNLRDTSIRHIWLHKITGTEDEMGDGRVGQFGWIFSKNVQSIFRKFFHNDDPFLYVFKDAATAVEFKLRFG